MENPPFEAPDKGSPFKLMVTLFLVTTSLIAVFQGLSFILLPRVLQQFDPANKVGNFATITSISAVLTVGGLIAGGAISDRTRSRWGRRTPTVVITCGIAAAILAGMGTATSVTTLLVLAPALWLTLAFFQSGVGAMLPDRVPLADRGKAAASIALGTPIGLFIGVNIASGMSSTLGAYLALAGMLMVGTACLILITPERSSLALDLHAGEAKARSPLFSAFRHRNFTLTFVSRALLFLSFFAVTGYLLFLLQDYIGLEHVPGHSADQGVSQLLSMITIAWLVATPITGFIADRVKRTQLVVGLTSIGIGLAVLVPSLSATWPAMMIFAIGSGLAFGIYFAIDLKLMSLVLPNPESDGRDLGILGIATAGPQILTPVIAAGLIGLGGYHLLFGFGAVLAILGGVVAFFIRLSR